MKFACNILLNQPMKKIYLLCLLCSFVTLQAQTWTWDSLAYQSQRKLCKDKYYGIYSYFDSTIIKLHPHGGKLYSLTLPSNVNISSIATCNDSTFFVGASFTGSCTIGSNVLISRGSSDLFIAHYQPNGNLIWIRTLGSKEMDGGVALCVTGTEVNICGQLGDTAYFMSQPVAKEKNPDLFVAKISSAGALLAFKCSVHTDTVAGRSEVYECAADPSGNIYLLASSYSKTKIETMSLNNDGYKIIKLNSQLQPVWHYDFDNCDMHCFQYYSLKVNSMGECYYIISFSYGQSGSDIETSSVNKLSASGYSLSVSYSVQVNRRGTFSNLDLDKYDNVYFTGYIRSPAYSYNERAYMLNGQLGSQLTPNWIKIDSSAKYRCGFQIQALAYNDCYVSGIFLDSLPLKNILVDTVSGQYPISFFHGRLVSFLTIGLREEINNSSYIIYPNPAEGILNIKSNAPGRVIICDLAGSVLFSDLIKSDSCILDISQFSAGCYIVEWRSEEGRSVSKLIIQ
jgi:hypothetical protein